MYTDQEYRDDTVWYVGKLRTGFENLKQGLIPNTELTIQLDFNDPDFSVWSPPGTATEYMLEIKSARMYMPVAQLNLTIHTHLKSELEKAPALYYYRELRCVTHPIAKLVHNYESPELRLPTQAALKIYIGLVKRSAKLGHQNENP